MQQHAQLLRRVTQTALGVALTLVVAKALAWWLSGSVSLLAGLTDSLLDAGASLLNLLAVRYALRPADEDHRYGHGKAEALAALAQALLISTSAVLVAIQAAERLQQPQPLQETALGVGVMLLSLLLTSLLLMFQRHVVRLTGSMAVRADSLHYRSDLLLNSGILVALLLSQWGWPSVDGLCALLIAGYILWGALSIVREAVAVLMDEALEPSISTHIQALALEVPGVLGVSGVRSRMTGSHWFVEINLQFAGDLPLQEAHRQCQAVAELIRQHYPRSEVLANAAPLSPPSG